MAPPPPKNPKLYTYQLCFLLLVSTTIFSAALTTPSYSTVCPSLTSASDSHTEPDDALSLTRSFQVSTGYFSGGGDSLFSPDDDDDLYNGYRSFSLLPHGASRTKNQTLVHLTATLTLTGPRSSTYQGGVSRHKYTVLESISFFLDGYYSSDSLELCMAGTGTEFAADGSLKRYPDVSLRLRVPSPPSLVDPFLVGSLDGAADFGTHHLLAYAEGDDYKYGSKRAACSPPTQAARGSLQALGNNSMCAHLKEQLRTSYRLEHGGAPLMHVNQVQCTADGAVRAYMVFSNDTGSTGRRLNQLHRQRRFLVDEEAAVADGQWDSAQGVLCLTACRVVRSPSAPSVLAVREHECGMGMSFWFPAVWTLQQRSVVAGMLWNSTQETAGNKEADTLTSGAIFASSIDVTDNQRSNLTDVKYNYNETMIEEARNHYLKIKKEKIKGSDSFPSNYTYRDFEFRYHGGEVGMGHSYPITIGSVMVYGERLAADDSFSHHAMVDSKQDLLSVSYDIHHHAPPDDWVRPTNGSYSVSLQERRISAEGVYDPKRGLLSMMGCREQNGSTDCRILVTVQFASLEARGQGHGRGVITSLREETYRLFFEKIDIHLFGMYSNELSEAISRMDLESIMLVASTTLSCVFTILQILHTKKNPSAAQAMSITMLTILTLGYLTPLVLNFEALFSSRRSRYSVYSMGGSLEIKEVMMRAPTLIAFVLQLRLLQLAWFGRRKSVDQTTPSPVASERIVLQICLPLYLLGAVLAMIVHVINIRAAREDPLVVRIGGEAATIWQDLVSYAGLILDGFLLPQVILNASLAGVRVRPLSSWFYIGCTMNRVMPHVYDVVKAQIYEQSINPSDLYASPRGDLFGVAWDIVIPCGAALLATLLFLQQRLGGAASLPSQRRRSGGYELVSTL